MIWLDTQTKEILRKEPEPKLAPPKAAEFGLVLLRKGGDHDRLIRAICRINNCRRDEALKLANFPMPVIISSGLIEEEALFGQFELICCDAAAVFIRSEVLLQRDDEGYLRALFARVLQSREFKPVRLDVVQIPATEAGQRFVDQFLSGQLPSEGENIPEFSVWVPFKKARIMKHWAARVGAQVECETLNDVDEADAEALKSVPDV